MSFGEIRTILYASVQSDELALLPYHDEDASENLRPRDRNTFGVPFESREYALGFFRIYISVTNARLSKTFD